MYSQHPLSAKFPSLDADQFQELVSDIRANGLEDEITLYEGEILDGWNRYRACLEADVAPRFIEYTGNTPAAFVLSKNVHRRNLTNSQRSMLTVECNKWKPSGRPKKDPTTERGARAPVSEKPSSETKTGTSEASTAQMASQAGTSEDSIKRAKAVSDKGSDELKKAVLDGEVSVNKAAKVASTTPKKQQAKAAKEKPAKKPKKAPEGTVPQALYDELVKEYADLRENRDDLAAELEACEMLRADELVIRYKQLQVEMRSCKRSRDEAMTKVVDLGKAVERWKKEAVKLGWTPKEIAKK